MFSFRSFLAGRVARGATARAIVRSRTGAGSRPGTSTARAPAAPSLTRAPSSVRDGDTGPGVAGRGSEPARRGEWIDVGRLRRVFLVVHQPSRVRRITRIRSFLVGSLD